MIIKYKYVNRYLILVWFYGTSTIKGYLMPNAFYGYISDIYDLSTHFVDNIFKWVWAHFLHTVKWFHLFVSNMNNSI